MKRLGLVVRCDFGGGLANQTREMHRWLEPDATLVVMMGDKGRGTPEVAAHYDPAYVVHYQQADTPTMQQFLSEIDVLLSVETFYEPFLLIRGGELGIERVLYANPELLNWNDPAEQADRYLWPAEWVQPFPVEGEILPWPCSTDVEPRAEVNWPPRFVHVGAPAMLDRNGTEIVEAAKPLVREAAHLKMHVSGSNVSMVEHIEGIPTVYMPPVEDHWDLYRDADLLVLPRRYGCLSLTMLEAAAMGVPTLTTDLLPQSDWFRKWRPWLTIPAGPSVLHSMKGSQQHLGLPGVPVHDPRPEDLALAMDRLAGRADVLDALRVEVREWAEARSWEKLKPAWDAVLR